MKSKGFVLLLVLALATPAAHAGNGHNLHGIGAVNSALGGAGVALPNDALGALLLNPALLADLDGNRFSFSAEYNTQKNAVESRVGTFSGRTEDECRSPSPGASPTSSRSAPRSTPPARR
jgi:long-chain fatty acid transport protein